MSQRRFERSAQQRQAAATRRRELRRRQRAGLAVGAVGAAVLMAPAAAGAATFTVDTGGDGADGEPGTTLRDAVVAANGSSGPDEIVFAANVRGTIHLTRGELIVNTDEGHDLTITGPGATELTISGADDTEGSAKRSRIFNVSGAGEARISGLTVADGNGTENGEGPVFGGAILNRGDLTLTDSVVKNSTALAGGGIATESGSETVVDRTTVTGNVATGSEMWYSEAFGNAGGILSLAPLTLTQSTVSGNTANENGGGIAHQSEKFPAEPNWELSASERASRGILGDGYSHPGELRVEDSTVSDNATGRSGTGGESGGGFYLADFTNSKSQPADSDVSITRTTVAGNDAKVSGGGIEVERLLNGNSFELTDSTVSGNTLKDTGLAAMGGGINFRGPVAGPATVSNSTVSGNSAGAGGGVHAGDQTRPDQTDSVADRGATVATGSIELANSTIASNAAERGGGVVAGEDAVQEGGGNVALTSTIVALNTGSDLYSVTPEPEPEPGTETAPQITPRGGTAGSEFDSAHSLIQDKGAATVNTTDTAPTIFGQDPQLGALTNNGGPTQTHLPGQSSPALDKGDNPDGLANDQRQSPFGRLVDLSIGNAAGGDGTDIGAVERPVPSTGAPSSNPSRPLTPSSAPAICGRRAISLVRADRRGNKVRLRGLVGAALYGRTVTIQTDPKGAKASAYTRTATVRASRTGEFSATVPAPAAADYLTVRYRAVSGSARSPALKLPQSLITRSVRSTNGTITVTGAVKKSVLGKRNRVTVRRLVCGRYRTVGSAKPDANGVYRITFRATPIGGVAFYRAESRVLRKPGSKVYVIQYARAVTIRTTSQTG